MEKIINIEGMTCGHCQSRVEKALNAIDGVTVKVNLAANNAIVTLSKEVSNQVLMDAVEEAGYDAISVK